MQEPEITKRFRKIHAKNLLHCRQNPSARHETEQVKTKRYDVEENLVLSRRTIICTNHLAPYSCFEKGRLTNGEKLTRQCQKLLWIILFLRLHD